MRSFLFAVAALAGVSLADTAKAQIALGESGITVTTTGTYASDYLFRGISQTRSRMAYQGATEAVHTSGVYVGGFISNVNFQGWDARQEVDVYGGYRVTLGGFNLDFGGIGYLYPGYTAPQGGASPVLDFAEMYVKATREVGPVNLLAAFNYSPNYFGRSGEGFYIEGGADWKTGVWDLMVGGRVGYQWIQRNQVFGTPDYAWWSLTVSREFPVSNIGTIVATVGYYDTSINKTDCIFGTSQNICDARAYGSIAFRF
jgi:uncharacterized protein (TIGR02001 family)